ncbi:glycerol-3-phosphate dehydrogenase subunit GlpB [Natrarchaeobaculum aegyptiacum]|uniref:Anaerobic glycerol-3-phosphate dehydrogenase subunit B n=1 Tax=Natrarchaeobaculum aegyptiacum TaxID=745377 RepID=A0A2Z2HTA5_9EURY|nr:glycerol-3-phosphate dehydrogenase subunit GlpB [Natrarchaeobaculum aegyptiacum]ARS90456.1 anaerobic glycerol-3-phosphate dehydrogenase subunit B [Natrarchaeobaculum aegyptiacum]
MAIEDDVLVVGGGLAGATAALAAAREDVRVRIVSATQSTLRQASGLIDVLGYPPDGAGTEDPIVDPFDAIADLPTGHPYERVGADAVRDALEFFDRVAGDAYAGSHTDVNALVPTYAGRVKPTARYPAATAAGLASDPRDTLLVGFDTIPDFDAPLAAGHLEAAGVPFAVRGVTVSFPGIERDDAKVTRYAHLLDRNEPVWRGGSETGSRAALASVVEDRLAGESRVGFPAILGDDHATAVRTDLEAALDVDVFEVPMGPPSLPGLRLEDLLYGALEDAGVRVTTGVPVVDYESARGGADDRTGADSDRIGHVVVDRNGAAVPHRADQYVLATGGLVGTGIESDREQVTEPVFDCHVAHPDDRYDWFVDDVFGDQPYARFGVDVDRDLRPLEAGGGLEFSNLRAAGSVLSGYDFAAEKSGSGVSLATGYVAGTRAAAEVTS